ncbi:THO complex component (Rlr1), putative [Talaromyces stipitatus ATCC 10500]|uniref:THO complex subunit 2 n=1 Tax=Talaromyces stipitatus (strain ATCC 10500 / CBS 375.48 / QM 6759 / NRRL 1006) TaxID=441959 RepID=B8MR85_TALSN|nr:THO complex component (Rlr1), putative [Talaromyces stipitatus ATCC 10500]EED12980.1 THO complex component (Rlr1), putative [Talaromyces stipitatus ATCC 10500]
MASGAGGKRKRGDRSWSSDSGHDGQRPSPHRPGNLNLAQHNQTQSPSSRSGSGDNNTGGRGRRPSRGGRTPSGRVQTLSQDQSKPSTDSSMAPPSTPQPNAVTESRQPNGASATRIALSKEGPLNVQENASYAFDYVTQQVVAGWVKDGKQIIMKQGVTARKNGDLVTLGCVFQEIIRAVLSRNLDPSEAGEVVKQILTENGQGEMGQNERASSFFLNTLSILAEEKDGSNEILKPFVFATEISPALLRLELDTNLIQSLGLVRDTFTRIGIRKQTNILYRQSNYNLLREESEGYSKLVTELFTTSNTESPSSEIVEETFERVKAMIGAFDLDVGRVLDVTLDVFAAVLVKKYHFFVRFLRASSWWPKGDRLRWEEETDVYTGLPSWALPGWTGRDDEKKEDLARIRDERDQAFWGRVREAGIKAFFEIGRRSLSDEEKQIALAEASNSGSDAETRRWIEETGTLPPKGNRVAAQLLGFKLRFYSTAAREAGHLPENLIWVAALLIKIGFISLRDLYPHLWREDESMPELEEKIKKEKLEREMKAKPGGGVNALMLAGALPDDTVPPPVSRSRDAEARSGTPAKDNEAAVTKDDEEKEPLPDIREQKIDLLKSLLTIGAIPEALYMLSRFPWLMDIPELPDYIHRIIHHCLSNIYAPLRPMQGSDQIRAPRPIPSADQSGVAKGHVRLADSQPRRMLRWAHPDKEDREDGINYRFYWDHWADTIPICQNVDDFFALASSLLNVSGFRIGQDPLLMSKIARIAQDSLNKDDSESNKNRWRDFCKRLLLPALSLSKKNPGVANEVFAVIRHFPRAVRYNMYAEWHFGQTSRLPEIKTAFDLATAQTRDTLKRLSKTNIKAMARALAEIAYANPGIVINVEITQIESYDNLIDVVVECARYFTDLGYDILAWALINALGQKGRSRVQQGGLLTSRWLNALSTFTGKAFKRYSVLNPTPILQYVLEQLRQQNSTDLIVLERVISAMAGIVTDTNFNEAQIQGMAGGNLLQSQTMLQLLDKRHESRTTSKRLMKALTDSKMAGQLLIAIAQERLLCIYRESEMVPELKLLGNIFDEIHRILTQYLDLLRSNLAVEEFDSFVPSLPELLGDFGLQPEIAFWIMRPSICKQIAEADRNLWQVQATQSTEASVSEPKAADADVEMTEGENTEKNNNQNTDGVMDVDKPSLGLESTDVTETRTPDLSDPTPNTTTAPWHPVLQGLMDCIQPVLPEGSWQTVGLPFYVTFWQLSLYDIHIPGKAYEDEIERQKRKVQAISNDRTDVSLAGTQRKEKEKKQIQELQDRLLEENKTHLVSYETTRNRLQKEKDHWFPGMRGKYDVLNIALLEQCFLPRILLSPIDGFYCFKILKFLHASGTPNFRTAGLIDQLLREHRLTAIIFQCTSKEADNFGKFINEILRDMGRWHADKSVYEKEAFGSNRTLPGFATNVDSEGKVTSFLEYENFRRLLYKWHRLLLQAIKHCFNNGEYMHIRNAISVLKAVSQHYPAVNWMGRDILMLVNELSNDEREDVKIPAASLKGELSRREKQWLLPQEFMFNEKLANEKGKAHTPRAGSATPKQLNAQAAEFKPPGANGTPSETTGKMEVEDGEIEDAKMADASLAGGKTGAQAEIVELAASEKSRQEPPVVEAPAADSATKDQRAGTTGQEEKKPLPAADRSATASFRDTDSARPRTESPAQSRQGSRPPDGSHAANIPKRPDIDRVTSQPPRLPLPPNLPNKPEAPRIYRHDSRSGRQADMKDDRRETGDVRPSDSSRSSRYPPDSDRDRLDGQEPRGPGRLERDRADPQRLGPPNDDQFRSSRDARHHREPEADRSGSSRAQPHPERANLIQGHPDRLALIEGDNQRRDPSRLDRDDRRHRPSSPTRGDDRRAPRRDEYPAGPRSDRVGRADMPEGRELRSGGDAPHGRGPQDSRTARQPEPTNEIPLGPRGRVTQSRGRNASITQPPPPGTPSRPSERLPPTGPSGRSSGRAPDTPAAPPPTTDKADTGGVHPDRLKNLQVSSESGPANTRSQASLPPSGPRSSLGHHASSPATRTPPSGPGNDRNRGDKRFSGINNMLQQSSSAQERGGQGTMIRGRGRQAQESAPASPQVGKPDIPTGQERTELFPGAPEADTRPPGRGRRGEASQEASRDSRRSGKHDSHSSAPDRDRRDEEEATKSGRRDERRDRGRDRDRDRERNRRNENAEDESHHGGRDSTNRRVTGSRDDHRKRDRRDREDAPSELPGPSGSEHHGRHRPSSSHSSNNNALPNPPPAPPGPPSEDRRWGGGSGRGENRDRDRNRDRGGRDRDRDFNRDNAPGNGNQSLPRKRGRPGDDTHGHGDGSSRGMRVGSESKRARRGT